MNFNVLVITHDGRAITTVAESLPKAGEWMRFISQDTFYTEGKSLKYFVGSKEYGVQEYIKEEVFDKLNWEAE